MRTLSSGWIVLLTAGLSAGAPIPKGSPKEPLYYPVKPGTKWEYGVDRKTIKSVDIREGETILTFVWEDATDKNERTERLAISTKGVFRLEAHGEKIDPPLCLLKLPRVDGQKWESARADGGCTGSHAAFGPEDVTVPAGRYKAIRVVSEYKLESIEKPIRRTDWFAPGVGLIKSVFGDAVIELSAFSTPKD